MPPNRWPAYSWAMRPLLERAPVSASTRLAIEAAVSHFSLLEQVVRWGFGCAPPRPVVDVVVQDEFTHDVVLAWDGTLHLAFDTT
jgi:hypothetical protein